MTVTTDLFLNPSPAATTGNRSKGASSVENGRRDTIENDPDRFKKHLAQKADNKGDSKTDKRTATDKAEENSLNTETVPSYDQASAKSETNEPVSDTIFNIQTAQSETPQAALDTPDITITSSVQDGQQENGPTSAKENPVNVASPQQATASQNQNTASLTNSPDAKIDTSPVPQTADSLAIKPVDRSDTPISPNTKIIQNMSADEAKVASGAPDTTNKAQTTDTALSKLSKKSAIETQDMTKLNNTALSNTGQNVTNQKSPELNSLTAEKAAASNNNQTPDVTRQQMAIAGTAVPKEATNRLNGKETPKDFDIKKSDKGDDVTATDNKKQTLSAGDTKTSSENATKDKGSAKTASANTSTAANSQTPLSAKLPFLTEAVHSMMGAEGKAGHPLTLQLPPGLLSVQETGQNAGLNNGLTATGQIKTPLSSVNPQMVTGQIRMAIAKQVDNGQQSFRISLKPAELGQVDIRMDFLAEGRMTATVTVENERTLALLQRDQSALEKTLENAGFNVGSDDLNFTLKQQNQGENEFSDNGDGEDGDNGSMPALPASIISQQQMKMAYSDNILDINI